MTLAADSPAVLQKRAQHLQIVFQAGVADALDKRLRNAETIRLDRREPGKTDQRRRNIGAVQRTEAVVAAAVELPLQNIDRDIAKVDPCLERVRAVGIGEVVLQLVLVFDAVDDRERRLAEVREAGNVHRSVRAAGGAAVRKEHRMPRKLKPQLVHLVAADHQRVLRGDGPVVKALRGRARE